MLLNTFETGQLLHFLCWNCCNFLQPIAQILCNPKLTKSSSSRRSGYSEYGGSGSGSYGGGSSGGGGSSTRF